MVLVFVAGFASPLFVTVTLVVPDFRPVSVMVELEAPFETAALTTVLSAGTAVTAETAPVVPMAVAVTVAVAFLLRLEVADESTSEVGSVVESVPVAESNSVLPAPSLMTKFVIVAFTLLNEMAG